MHFPAEVLHGHLVRVEANQVRKSRGQGKVGVICPFVFKQRGQKSARLAVGHTN